METSAELASSQHAMGITGRHFSTQGSNFKGSITTKNMKCQRHPLTQPVLVCFSMSLTVHGGNSKRKATET